MKATELRIGNFIQLTDKWFDRNRELYNTAKVVRVSEIVVDPLSDSFIISGNEITDFEPIPLTEEWLKKFGFEKDGTNYRREWLYLHGNNRTGTIDFLLNEPYSNLYRATVLRYVHQLQNLYFALTGEELEIK